MSASGDYRRIERALHFVEAHAEEQPTLAEIAEHVGLSAFHFQRLFHRWAGITPKDFLQCVTLERAKALLRESRSLLDVSLEVGLSGAGRLHDLFLNLEAMTPGAYKRSGRGLTITWGVHETPFGEAVFAATERGLCALSFVDDTSPAEAASGIQARWPEARLIRRPDSTSALAEEVRSRMRGEVLGPLSLILKGSAFQVKVWEALLSIPEGEVTSYQGLARMIGSERSARAVGTAVSLNPIAYLIPCHRVIRATGVIGEYRWGASRKQALLGLEGARRSVKQRVRES